MIMDRGDVRIVFLDEITSADCFFSKNNEGWKIIFSDEGERRTIIGGTRRDSLRELASVLGRLNNTMLGIPE